MSVDLATIPFTSRRVFTVSATSGPSTRGGHTAGCEEFIALVTGGARFRVTRRNETVPNEVILDEPGRWVLIAADDYVEYDLLSEDSTIIVFASETFDQSRQKRDVR